MQGKKPGESTRNKPSPARNQFFKSTGKEFLNTTGVGAAALSSSPSPLIYRERTSLL